MGGNRSPFRWLERLSIEVTHLPPGTSECKTSAIASSSFISQNWQGKPLVSQEVIVQLIAAPTITTGLKVHSKIDKTSYPIGIKVPDEEIATLYLERDDFHGEWNYRIRSNYSVQNDT